MYVALVMITVGMVIITLFVATYYFEERVHLSEDVERSIRAADES